MHHIAVDYWREKIMGLGKEAERVYLKIKEGSIVQKTSDSEEFTLTMSKGASRVFGKIRRTSTGKMSNS